MSAQDGSPEAVAQAYLDALQADDGGAVVALMDPEDLAEIKRVYALVLADQGLAGDIYGDPIRYALEIETADDLDALSPADLYMAFLDATSSALQLALWEVDLLGVVPEGEADAHVLVRTSVTEDGLTRAGMDVISLRLAPDGWRVRLPVAARSDLAAQEALLRDGIED